MPKWTNQQAKAIDERNKNILVSAAAGSGKTAVLVERILKLIVEERVDITEMLIVTFTNAAAGEMRERILTALATQMVKDPVNADFLRRQMNLLNRAHIKTLHAFCMDVIRQNFHQLDIDPAFRIGDMSELTVLKQQILDDLMETTYEKADPAFIDLVESYSGNRSDEKLQGMILKLHTFLMSKPEPAAWLKEMLSLYDIDLDNLHQHIWMQTLLRDAKDAIAAAKVMIDEALMICNLPEGPEPYAQALESDLLTIEKLEEAMSKDMLTFIQIAGAVKYERLKTIPKKLKEQLSESLIAQVKSMRDHMKKDMIDPIKKGFSAFNQDMLLERSSTMKPMMTYLGDLALQFETLFTEAKRQKDMLDFNDLEHLTIHLFKDPEIADQYRRQFKYLFVDEYQDSNIVQETILGAIKRSNNRFMVGDVKQSIYKFRLADPTLFMEKYDSYPVESVGQDLRIDLNKNFRSRNAILESINYLFKHLMSKNFGEIEYDQAAALYTGMDFEDHIEPALNLHLIDLDPPHIELEEELLDMTNAEAEARAIALEIKNALKTKTYDPRQGTFRKTNYRDMVLLLRATRSWAPVFQEVFEEEGIPLYAESNTGYFDTMEIRILLDFLRIVDNQQQDIPLMSVLRSPIFGFKTNELVEIRVKYPKLSYYQAMKTYAKENDTELGTKIESALETVDQYHKRAQYEKLNELIWSILIETRYYYYVGALPGGDIRQANLKILVNHADDFERTSLTGLFSFIRYLELVTSSSGDMGEARTLNESDDVLRLMSIHKSKGLEFPIVFVAGLGKQFNQMDIRSDIILHKDLGITARYVDAEKRVYNDSLGISASKKQIKLENLAEEMRILYVALTRAVDKLYLFGTVKNMEKNMDKWLRGNAVFFLKKAQNYLGWLMPIMMMHPDFENLIQTYDKESHLGKVPSDTSWSVKTQHIQEVFSQKVKQIIDDETLKNTLKYEVAQHQTEGFQHIQQQFTWQYPHAQGVHLAPKISVTDLNKLKGQEDLVQLPDLIEKPKFMSEETGMEGADFGTLIHAFMEHIQIQETMDTAYLKSEVNRMVERGILSEESSKAMRMHKIKTFFASDIGQRLISSNQIRREQPFVLAKDVSEYVGQKTEPVIVQGIVDCYFEEADGLVIVDYKTDSTKEQTPNDIAKKYEAQIQLYAEALSKGTGKEVKEAVLYLFSSDEAVKII